MFNKLCLIGESLKIITVRFMYIKPVLIFFTMYFKNMCKYSVKKKES